MTYAQRLRKLADSTGLDAFGDEIRAIADEMDEQPADVTDGTARQFVEWMKAQPHDREPTTIDGALAEFEAHHGITPKDQPNDLWCIHIPGTDEVHAAPSKEAADHMAAKHNAAMATYYASGNLNLECAPPLESVQASVIKWPHDQQSHADELREFDWAGWGIKPKEQA